MSHDEVILLDIIRIHGYDIVDLDEVWKTVDLDVPQVLPQLEALLP